MSFASNDAALSETPFDPLSYINSTFTSSASLDADLSAFSASLNKEILKLDRSISSSIQSQSTASKNAQEDIKQAQQASLQLRTKIEDVKQKAMRSEEMVKVICADIKQLDFAKRHLQTTITSLKRLHMLHNAVGQLTATSKSSDFKAAALSLQAVQALMAGFEDFTDVPKIKDLQYEVGRVRKELSTGVFAAFSEIGSLASATANPNDFQMDDVREGGFKNLAEACLVVDALGKEARDKQMEQFCESQLKSYRNIFNPTATHSSLEQIERRFAWFRRLLKSIDEKFREVFPPHWHLQYKLCWLFLEQSKEGIMSTLEDEGNTDSENVIVIVKALQKTIMFEKEMTARLERDYGSSVTNTTVDPKAKYDNAMEYDETGNEIDPRSAEGIKLRYARERAKQKSLSAKTGVDTAESKEEYALLPLGGMLSGVFLPFMGPYCQLEKQNLDELLQKAVTDTETDQRGDLPVFTSAVNLFVYVKNSITRGTALTTGVVFFNLYKEYKGALQRFSKVLQEKMPAPYVAINVLASLNAGAEKAPPNPRTSNYKVAQGEEETVCLAIDTCEYCAETIEALEELIKEKVDEGFKDSVDLMDVQDEFFTVSSIALRILVSGLDNRIEPCFKDLVNTNWSSFDDVGEESLYVRNCSSLVTTFASNCQKILPSSYYRNFCDKFASSFMASFHNSLVKCKRFSQIATQQLLLDVYSLKKLILGLPALNSDGGSAPAMYVTHVTSEFSKIELLLKLIGTPTELLVEVFKQQWSDGSLKDFQQVLSLRGMKRVQQ
eukprot:CAMPEP_0118656486 /NCGR_PEP_ID=MMETSP0785-20121206/13513_1 /TAXON_ID=91992 /ORGANISM="Bolidomonas pacifica, Strain CCMP 1866" /LENGTH=779 /DNA_ID=CAMNT_0006549345 /DNA_START=237 /DNA_END=2573 /DNA_ORIENTATION=-